jgi:DNA-binding CsgD family transcriptional regulator
MSVDQDARAGRHADSAILPGRERECAAVDQLLSDAVDGSGRLAMISGGAGVGRTALLAAAAHRARLRGFTVLTARGSAAERDLRFGVADRLLDVAAAVEPSRGELAGDASLAELHARHRALATAADDNPTLIVVDDLQWVDRQSLRWLSTLPQRVERARVAVLVGVCDGEPCADPAAMEELLAGCSVEVVPAPLDDAAAADLLERVLGWSPDLAFLTACMAATGGKPALLTAVAEASRTQGATAPPFENLVLSGLASCLHVRLRRISPQALAVVRAVAVLGVDATLDRVAVLAQIDAVTTAEVTTRLCRARLLCVAGNTVTFAYPLLRHVIVQQAPLATQRDLHANAARLLHEVGAPNDSIAGHLVAAPALGEQWPSDVLRAAARSALGAGAPAEAVAYLRRALGEPLPDTSRSELLAELGLAETYVDVVPATRHLTEAVERMLPQQNSEAALHLARLLAAAGDHRTAVRVVTSRTQRTTTDLLCLVELHLCAEATAPRGAELLSRLPAPRDTDDRGRWLSLLAMRASWAGRSAGEAGQLAERALMHLRPTPETLSSIVRSVLVLAHAGRVLEAHERCDELVALTRRWQHRPGLAAARSARTVVGRLLGRLPAAAQDGREALDLLAACGAPKAAGETVEHLARLVEVLVDLGANDEANELIERSELDDAVPNTWSGMALLHARGRLRSASGQHAHAARDLLAVGARSRAWEAVNPAVVPWHSSLALALDGLGESSQACRHAEVAVGRARRWGAPGPLGVALRTHAAVAGGRAGLAMLEESAAVLERAESTLDRASSLLQYGKALNDQGQPVAARQALRAAIELAERSGHTELSCSARLALSACGGRQSKPRQSGIASLTAAELRTATLAAAGRKNREIAATLFVRRRTVEIHLTNVYRKLGIDGRSGLPVALNAR